MSNAFLDPLILRYVRDRLTSECKPRGASTEISRATGIHKSHISHVIDGTRGFGEEFVSAMCKYWRMKKTDLGRIAHETYASNAYVEGRPKTHPDLDATLEFCRPMFPVAFLNQFELAARRQPDRTRLQWLHELHFHLRAWLSRQPPSIQRRYWSLLGMPLASIEVGPVPTLSAVEPSAEE